MYKLGIGCVKSRDVKKRVELLFASCANGCINVCHYRRKLAGGGYEKTVGKE